MQTSALNHRPGPVAGEACPGDAGDDAGPSAPPPGRRDLVVPAVLQGLPRAPAAGALEEDAPAQGPRAASSLRKRAGAAGDAAQRMAEAVVDSPVMTLGVASIAAGQVIGHRAAGSGDVVGQLHGSILTAVGSLATAASLGTRLLTAAMQPPEFARPLNRNSRLGPVAPPRAETHPHEDPAGDGPRRVSQKTSSLAMLQQAVTSETGVEPEAWVEPSGWPGIGLNQESSPEFRAQVRHSLQQLQETPTGRAVLRQIEAIHAMYPDKQVVIQPTAGPTATQAAWREPAHALVAWNFAESAVAQVTGDPFMPYVAGRGVDTAVVRFNPEQGRDYASDADVGRADARLAFVDLGHELIHASHFLHGASYGTPLGDSRRDRNSAAAEEELRTTGAGPWRDEPVSDNGIRRDLGLAQRLGHGGNRGERLREPPERNSPQTERKLAELGAKLKQD
jgi:hypothetical protein